MAASVAQELAVPPVSYPSLPRRAASAEGFVPEGWRLETKALGDLDRDGTPDLALVLRQHDPKNVVANESGLGENPLDTNPRILAVAVRSNLAGDYELKVANHALIPRRVDPVLDDPLAETGGISIRRGVLRVALHQFASVGSWGMGTTTYSFQWRSGRFQAIGFDLVTVARNSGATEDVSINFLTGQVKHTTGSIGNSRPKVVRTRLGRPAPDLAAIGDGLSFDPQH